jgi:hypothetical protein
MASQCFTPASGYLSTLLNECLSLCSHDARLHLFGNPKTRTWLSGDCHCCNFGSFHNRRGETVYALNDFDESLVGDYQMDLWRLAVSILLAMKQVGVGDSDKVGRFASHAQTFHFIIIIIPYLHGFKPGGYWGSHYEIIILLVLIALEPRSRERAVGPAALAAHNPSGMGQIVPGSAD